MKDNIESFGVPVKKQSLLEFESLMGPDALPEDYRQFLLCINGGYTKDNDTFNFANGSEGSMLGVFYGLSISDDEFDDYELTHMFNQYVSCSRIPKDFIPIASDAGGNQICIGIKGKHFGEVWFWDHEEESEDNEEATMKNMILISKTFTEFIDGLYELKLDNED